jgi:hypothetical protein
VKTSPLNPVLSPAPPAIRWPAALTRDLLALGEIVPATVVTVLDAQRALMQIKGRQVLAEVPFPLPERGEFQVRVEQLEPRVVLRLLAEAASDQVPPEVRLKAYLAGDRPAEAVAQAWQALTRIENSALPAEIRAAWKDFQETLTALSRGFESRPGAEVLRGLLDLSGLKWENKLQDLAQQEKSPALPDVARKDLKGFLLSLKARLETADPDLARAIQPILQKIELCQWLNASDSGKSHLLLFFPWWLPEGPGWTELLISGERSDRPDPSGETGQSLLFLLHLPVWGKLRVEVSVRGRSLYGRFKTERPEVAELLDRQTHRLQKGLSALGYEAVLESQVVEPDQLADPLVVRMETITESLISRVV